MAVPTPDELLAQFGPRTPELVAGALGFQVVRVETPPMLPGVTVFSAYEPEGTITLYQRALRALAAHRGEPMPRLEQWHIAHELYHGLAEAGGASAWRVRETEADLWADELLSLMPIEQTMGDGAD